MLLPLCVLVEDVDDSWDWLSEFAGRGHQGSGEAGKAIAGVEDRKGAVAPFQDHGALVGPVKTEEVLVSRVGGG